MATRAAGVAGAYTGRRCSSHFIVLDRESLILALRERADTLAHLRDLL